MFFSQRHKLKDISTLDVNYTDLPQVIRRNESSGGRGGRGGRGGGHGVGQPRRTEAVAGETEENKIFVQEHLTKYTKDLLKEAKQTFSALDFEYAGYIKDGEVRVKQTAADKYQTIRSKADIKRIKDEAGRKCSWLV